MAKTKNFRIMFEIIEDGFDPSDPIIVEDVHQEMRANWRNFIKNGVEPDSVVKLMAAEDIWENYDELSEAGSSLDMSELYSSTGNFFNEEFTKNNWGTLVRRGVSPDTLVDKCKVQNLKGFADALEKGISKEKAIELFENLSSDTPDKCKALLLLKKRYNLSKTQVEERLSRDELMFAISFYPELCESIDKETIESWIGLNGEDFLGWTDLSYLPEVIGVDKLVEHFSMNQILEKCAESHLSFGEFLADYKEAGGNISNFAQKYVNEIGYSSNTQEAMLDLVLAGASREDINPQRFVDSVDPNQIDEDDLESWYSDLKQVGYEEELISKFLRA